jgi:hypothetical protein
VLAVLVPVQWLATLLLATSVHHNGWVWYQGGDQMWYTTTGWLLGHAHLPPTNIGYGWAMVQLPVTWFTGATYVAALPVVVLFNVFVLGPIALACIYSIARRIAGATLGAWTAVLWIVLPFLAIPLFVQRYHDRWVDQYLPQAFGLTGLADYPSMVALLVSAALILRSLDRRDMTEAVMAGLVTGFAIGIKPANALFLTGVALAYLFARRLRLATGFGLALVPALVTLLIWKQRGLGTLPVFSLEEVRAAAGSTVVATESWFDRYVPLDWDVFRNNMAQLREFFWSVRLLQWIPIAGTIAIARRSLPAAGLVGGSFFAFVLVKGSSPVATVESGSFFRLLMPAWPAFLLCFALLPLLVPGVPRRISRRTEAIARGRERRPDWRRIGAAAAVLGAIPIVVVVIARPLTGPELAVVQDEILTPVQGSVGLTARREGIAQRLTWSSRDWGPEVFYRVYRTLGDGPDTTCSRGGATSCRLEMILLETTRSTSYVDGSPPPGVVYRIGVSTNWLNDESGGDPFVFSPPVPAQP